MQLSHGQYLENQGLSNSPPYLQPCYQLTWSIKLTKAVWQLVITDHSKMNIDFVKILSKS